MKRDCGGKVILYASMPWFNLAEGNYPFSSTYITFAVGPGLYPLPPWPMRAACDRGGLNADLGVKFTGNRTTVNYTVSLANTGLEVKVDWTETATTDGGPLVTPKTAGLTQLAGLIRGVSQAVGVWFNVTGKLVCNNVLNTPPTTEMGAGRGGRAAREPRLLGDDRSVKAMKTRSPAPAPTPSSPPPGCPNGTQVHGAWGGIGCNEHWNQVNTLIRGVGRDFFWPPSRIGMFGDLPRGWSYPEEVARRQYQCRWGVNDVRGYPHQRDAWSSWVDEYYGGLRIEAATNIVFSNGLMDPWSSGGVLSNVSETVIAVVIPDGAHHLDLMFDHPADPPSARVARAAEESQIRAWIKSSPAWRRSQWVTASGGCSDHDRRAQQRAHHYHPEAWTYDP